MGPPAVDASHVNLAAGVGVVVRPVRDVLPEELLRDADIAMYEAKRQGKRRAVRFTVEMHTRVAQQLELDSDLCGALEEGRLRLHFQPVVELVGGQVVGAEALVRWLHPVRGELLPGDFIDRADASGLIVPLGRWVLREACRQARAWQDAGVVDAAWWISVNLSPQQFLDPSLEEDVIGALVDAGLDAGRLVLEVTEDVLVQDAELVLERMRRLRAIGVRLVVDDFGTGYSSLSYLRQFPVDTLKIDRSFIHGLGVSGDTELAAAIVNLGRTMGLRTVAEGIEDACEARMLLQMGCELGQGYLYARPMPADLLGAAMSGGSPGLREAVPDAPPGQAVRPA